MPFLPPNQQRQSTEGTLQQQKNPQNRQHTNMKSQKYQKKLPKVLSKNDNKIRMLVLSTLILSTGQGSNSLGYKKIPKFSMVTEAFF